MKRIERNIDSAFGAEDREILVKEVKNGRE